MTDRVADLKAAILDRVKRDPPRRAWTPTDFLDLGSRDAIDKALQRLTQAGSLRRIDRGLYDQPVSNTLTKKLNPPDPRSVIEALGRRDQVRMLVDGMTAANDLGLTDAVPAKIVVHSDARRRSLKLGNVTITFRPTAASKLSWAGRPGMRVVQALHWMRDTLARDGEADRIRRKLRKLLDDPVSGPSLKADLIDGLTTVPTWMQVFLRGALRQRAHVTIDAADHHHDHDDQHGNQTHRSRADDHHNHPESGARLKRRDSSQPTAKTKTSRASNL